MKKRTLLVEIIILLLVLILILSGLITIHVHFLQYLKQSKTKLIHDIEALIGYQIDYQKLSPDIIGSIKIKQVALYQNKKKVFHIGDITVYYSILQYLRNRKTPLSLINKVKIKNIDLKMERSELVDKINEIRKRAKKPARQKNWLQEIDKLSLEFPKISLLITDAENKLHLTSKQFKINITAKRITINQLSKLELSSQAYPINFSGYLKTQGTIEQKEQHQYSQFHFDLYQMVFNENEIFKQHFYFESKDTDFLFYREQDIYPVQINVQRQDNEIRADIDIQDLKSNQIFVNKNNHYIPYTLLKLKSKLNYDLNQQQLNGSFVFYSYFSRLLFMKDFEIDLNLDLIQNQIYLNRFTLYNNQRSGFLDISSSKAIDQNHFSFKFDVHDFKILPFKLNSQIYLEKNKAVINLNAPQFLINDRDLGAFHFQVLLAEQKIMVRTLKSWNGYSISGLIDGIEKKIYLKHDFEQFALQPIIQVFQPDFKNKIALKGSVLLSGFSGQVFIPESTLELVDQKQNEWLKFNLLLNQNKFLVYKVFFKQNFVSAFFKVEPADPVQYKDKPDYRLIFSIQNKLLDLKLTSLFYADKIKLYINQGFYCFYDKNKQYFFVSANQFKIPFNALNTTVSTRFTYSIPGQIIRPSHFEFNQVQFFRNKSGKISGSLQYQANKLELLNLNYEDNENKITGNMVNELFFQDQFQLKGNFFLEDKSKGESYTANYQLEDQNINAKFFITHFDINKLLPEKINGFFNFRLSVNGLMTNPDIILESDIVQGKLLNNDLFFYLILHKTDRKIQLKKLNLQLNDNSVLINDLLVLLNREKKQISLKGTVNFAELRKKVKINLKLDGYYQAKDQFDFDFSLLNTSIEYQNFGETIFEKFDPIRLNIVQKGQLLTIKNYGPRFVSFVKDGRHVTLQLFLRKNPILSAAVDIQPDDLSGELNFYDFPINYAVQKLIFPFVDLQQGFIKGQLKLAGTPVKPEFHGELNVYKGVLLVSQYIRDPIINISGRIKADKNKLSAIHFNGMNENRGLVNGFGHIIFNGWKLDHYHFEISTNMVAGLIKQGPIDARGRGYVKQFIFEGKPKNFSFIGDLYIDDGLVNIALFQTNKNPVEPDRIPINVYITFTAGRKVVVDYPLINGTIKKDEQLILKYYGLENAVYFDGEVSLRKGEINYLNKNFKIEHGFVQFFDDESAINPYLNIKSYYRTKESGEKIKLYMDITDRLTSFKTHFYSVPFRNNNVINSMLGLTVARSNNGNSLENTSSQPPQQTTGFETISQTTNYLGNTLLFSPLENSIRSITRLDTFALDTTFFGNIFTSSNNLLDLLDDSSITLGKYIFDGIYFESMMTFNKKNGINETLFIPLPNQPYGFNLELMLQLELPFITLGYTFAPKDLYNFSNAEHIISLESNIKF